MKTVFTLISKASGVSSKSGKDWHRITVRANCNGISAVKEFFINSEVWEDVKNIEEDSEIAIAASLNQKLFFEITSVNLVNGETPSFI